VGRLGMTLQGGTHEYTHRHQRPRALHRELAAMTRRARLVFDRLARSIATIAAGC
jgi:hypothetical protein